VSLAPRVRNHLGVRIMIEIHIAIDGRSRFLAIVFTGSTPGSGLGSVFEVPLAYIKESLTIPGKFSTYNPHNGRVMGDWLAEGDQVKQYLRYFLFADPLPPQVAAQHTLPTLWDLIHKYDSGEPVVSNILESLEARAKRHALAQRPSRTSLAEVLALGLHVPPSLIWWVAEDVVKAQAAMTRAESLRDALIARGYTKEDLPWPNWVYDYNGAVASYVGPLDGDEEAMALAFQEKHSIHGKRDVVIRALRLLSPPTDRLSDVEVLQEVAKQIREPWTSEES
jgi:hypothetical protein